MHCLEYALLCLLGVGLCAGTADAMKMVGHRGESYTAPENTLAAANLAWKNHVPAVECDIHLTKDKRIILMHDYTTKRTTGVDLKISETNSDELRKLDAGSWKDKAYAGERIPFLEESIAGIPAKGKLVVEIKCGPEILPYLSKIIADSGKAKQIELIGFDFETMVEVKKVMPKILNFWLTGTKKNADTGAWLPNDLALVDKVKAGGLDGIDAHSAGVTKAFADALKAAGLKLYVWTVDDPVEAKRMKDLGADALTTNRPSWMKEQLKGK